MRRLAILLALIFLLSGMASASDVENELESMIGADKLREGLTEEQQDLMGDAEPTTSSGFLEGLQDMLSDAILHSGGYVRESAAGAAMILAVCLACGLCGTLEQTSPARAVTIAGILAVAGICMSGVSGLIRVGTETVHSLASFSQLLLPVLGSASVASGAVTSGPALYGITVLFSDVLLRLVTNVLIPLLYVFLAMALADCAIGNAMLKRFRELIAWAIQTGLKGMLYVFTGFLAITQVISGTADAMSAKAAKLTLSGVVPVVGSIISDASETVLVSAGLLKNSVGVYGMLAVIAICILPFLRIGIHYLILKITAAVSGTIAQDDLVSMIDSIAEAMGLLLAMTGACALLFLISAVCSLKAVGY